MARIIQPPEEWQSKCPKCWSLIGYTKQDIVSKEQGRMMDDILLIRCPQCETWFDIPTPVEKRQKVLP